MYSRTNVKTFFNDKYLDIYLELLNIAFLYKSNSIAALCSPSLSSSLSSVRLKILLPNYNPNVKLASLE